MIKSSVLPLDEEEDIRSLTKAIQEFNNSLFSPSLCPPKVVVWGNIGLAPDALRNMSRVSSRRCKAWRGGNRCKDCNYSSESFGW